ncbi:MAG: metallophosphoesterase [Clostridiales bacterium]|nr:metallophosphoesterase [Clostridiales bacterium]
MEWFFIVCVAVFLLLLLLCIYYNESLKCEYYTIPKEELPQAFWGSKIVMLADLHNHEFGKENIRLLAKIKKENPDYIMLAGDMLVKGETLKTEHLKNFFIELSKICLVYYAPGNHEEYLERQFHEEGLYKKFIKEIEECGVKYLANQSCYIEKENQKIRVTGLHLQKQFFARFYEKVTMEKKDLEELIGKSEECYEILIAHNPNYFSIYEKWGADLVLSGHVHGGIVILPFLGGVISTTYELFPKYDFGMFRLGTARMVLSRGLGTHTIKLRLFNTPEISVVFLGK